MARSNTVLIKTLEERPRHAGVEVNASSEVWVKTEPGGVDYVFKTERGPYRVLGGSSFEMLRSGGGTRVGRLANFDPYTVQSGATGQGLSDDAGLAVTWKVEGIADT